MDFSEKEYEELLKEIFVRFPSYQTVGGKAYHPGLENMMFFDQLLGHPHRKYRTVHIAGTDGKGSVSNMIASVLGAYGMKTGLYTSPHILDFRERMRIINGRDRAGLQHDATAAQGPGLPCGLTQLIPKESVFEFITHWKDSFEHIGLSFFEITTMMAFDWFAKEEVDIAVIETGLGGRLDSTNIITPELSVITNIGLDHCAILGNTLPEIAFEKAGIIKPMVPVTVGESHPETDLVFERKVLYTNLSETEFMGNRDRIMELLTFADKVEPTLWAEHEEILKSMDLQGDYQRKNLRTVLAALDVLKNKGIAEPSVNHVAGSVSCAKTPEDLTKDAIIHTAERMGFHGRWERLSEKPLIIADIGHNAHGLKYNFAQLEKQRSENKLLIVFGMVADKDIEAVLEILPRNAEYFFTNSSGERALPAAELEKKYLNHMKGKGQEPCPTHSFGTVRETIAEVLKRSAAMTGETAGIYIGGSTFVVAEALSVLKQ